MQKQERKKNGKQCTYVGRGLAWPAGSAPGVPAACRSVGGRWARGLSVSHFTPTSGRSVPQRRAQLCLSPFQIWLYAAAPATGRGKRPATPRAPCNRVVVSSKTPPEISIHSVRVISGSVAGLLRSEKMSVRPCPHPSHSGDREGSLCGLWQVEQGYKPPACTAPCGSNGFFYRFNYIESRLISKSHRFKIWSSSNSKLRHDVPCGELPIPSFLER